MLDKLDFMSHASTSIAYTFHYPPSLSVNFLYHRKLLIIIIKKKSLKNPPTSKSVKSFSQKKKIPAKTKSVMYSDLQCKHGIV